MEAESASNEKVDILNNIYDIIHNDDAVPELQATINSLDHHLVESALSWCMHQFSIKQTPIGSTTRHFVEHKLQTLRFSGNFRGNQLAFTKSDNHRMQLIKYLRERIRDALQYSTTIADSNVVDNCFLLHVEIIGKIASILQPIVKKLPVEQFLFYTSQFLQFHKNEKRISWYFVTLITKNKLRKWWEYFEKELHLLIDTKNSKIKNNQLIDVFPELMNDYYSMRDLHTLEWIHNYLKSVRRIDGSAGSVSDREYLCIIRVLMVLGEGIKNTQETPKVSTHLKLQVEQFLSVDAIKAIIVFRNKMYRSSTLPTFDDTALLEAVSTELNGICKCVGTIRINKIVELVSDIWNTKRKMDEQTLEFPFLSHRQYSNAVIGFGHYHSVIYHVLMEMHKSDLLLNTPTRMTKDYSDISDLLQVMTDQLKKGMDNVKQMPTTNVLELQRKVIAEITETTSTVSETRNFSDLHDKLRRLESIMSRGGTECCMTADGLCKMCNALELLVIVIIQQLNDMQLLNPTYHWIYQTHPTLMLIPLRNTLSHNNTILSALGVDTKLTLSMTARLLVTELKILPPPMPQSNKQPTRFEDVFSDLRKRNDEAIKLVMEQQKFLDVWSRIHENINNMRGNGMFEYILEKDLIHCAETSNASA